MLSNAYNIDCLVGMKKFPDKHFDLAVVDPPYGINIANRSACLGKKKRQGKITNYTAKKWDANTPDAEYFKELFRISKKQIIWGGNYFTDNLPPSKCWIVWDKKQPQGVSFAMAELAYTSFDMSTKIFSCSRALIGNKVSNNYRLALANAKRHPTQKPIILYEWIYKTFLPEGGKVIDTHLGSGTNRVAADKMGNIGFVGFEIDEEYFSDSLELWYQHKANPTLNFSNK